MSSREVRLLLVDDDPGAIQVMGRMLAQYPDQRFATSGEVALRLAREQTPDLILLDVDMPGMTGLDVCEALKLDPVLAQVPVIFATSHDAAGLQVAALRKGAADFITKPLVAAQLKARVRAQLRARQLADDLKREILACEGPARQPSRQIPRVLIVDDDIASIHILRHTLATMGDFHFAVTGEQALQLARRLVPDLIVLDAHMPGVDGFDVCRSLKAERAFRQVPIVFVTRFSDPVYEMRALDLGAADFIAKPYTPAVLQARVRNLLDLKRRTDADLEAVGEHWRRVSDARITDIVDAASDAVVTHGAHDRERLEAESHSRVQAEAASRTKTQMMSYIAHEMGNPLNGLLGFAQLMSTDAGNPLAPEQASRLARVVASGRDLQSLMRDVTDLGRFEAGKLRIDMRQVDAVACAQDAVAAVSAVAEQAGVSVSCASAWPSIGVGADADRLHQCLVNLLTNAIKYNRCGGWVRIELSSDSRACSIAVRDNGLGLDALQRQHLFEPFNRLGRQRAESPGAGLGLVITRQLVEAMNGQLQVESEAGSGSCFSIVLGLAANTAGARADSNSPEGPTPS
ncbi:hybrid sensor histidine kinase/response regulator [Aquabacterium sp.]|uniref:ATP-binding response regulator n=1 Tax=Aquabacterium sp. TaxID=1872578 RepID=UPI002B83DABF|nr:response regulator [Aquabacterium sp.]HSW06910.1 response regulator [Aquabacterium sp.]